MSCELSQRPPPRLFEYLLPVKVTAQGETLVNGVNISGVSLQLEAIAGNSATWNTVVVGVYETYLPVIRRQCLTIEPFAFLALLLTRRRVIPRDEESLSQSATSPVWPRDSSSPRNRDTHGAQAEQLLSGKEINHGEHGCH